MHAKGRRVLPVATLQPQRATRCQALMTGKSSTKTLGLKSSIDRVKQCAPSTRPALAHQSAVEQCQSTIPFLITTADSCHPARVATGLRWHVSVFGAQPHGMAGWRVGQQL